MQIHDPPMTFRGAKATDDWALGMKNNQDAYGHAVYRYASEWATRMEQAMTADFNWSPVSLEGTSVVAEWLQENADRISHEADTEGITGFMYGCAVSTLAGVWIHGEQLRRWHNLKTQLRHEGERANEKGTVLNPALLNIE